MSHSPTLRNAGIHDLVNHRHGPHAVFSAQCRAFNNGRDIGTLTACETRMAGFFYALFRALRLRAAFQATPVTKQWQDLKLGNADVLTHIAKNDVSTLGVPLSLPAPSVPAV